jgi:transcriptional regulatory protein RtcR
MKRNIAIGFLGNNLDGGKGRRRWEHWRPTVALCQQDDLVIDRLDLIHDRRQIKQAEVVIADIAGVSPETEVRTHIIDMRNPWDFQEVYGALHDFALDYDFNEDEEDYLVHLTTGTHVAQICWFLLTEARYIPGRLLQLSPPKAKESGPGTYSAIDLDLSRYDRLAQRFDAEREQGTDFLKAGIATQNSAFNAMIDRVEQVAIKSDAPLLLIGPTGAGKSELARRIYDLKRARHQVQGAFVPVNCSTLRGERALSTLFGHRRGAITGAGTDRAGLLRAANKGVVFLDEIDELGLDEQAMILHAVESGRFYPVGSDTEVESRFQLIAGANQDLAKLVAEGRFRADLFARLNLWTFHLPGLKSRREDIEPNVDYELARGRSGRSDQVVLNADARRRYLKFAKDSASEWTGNFRDLGSSIARMRTLAPRGRITSTMVEEEVERLQTQWRAGQSDPDQMLLAELLGGAVADLDRFDRVQLAEVIRVCRGSPSLSAAGRELFAASRARKVSSNDADRLRKYLERFGLEWSSVTGAR